MEWVMKMSRFQITQEEYEAIKAAEQKCRDKKTSKRLQILMLRYEGYKVADTERMDQPDVPPISGAGAGGIHPEQVYDPSSVAERSGRSGHSAAF